MSRLQHIALTLLLLIVISTTAHTQDNNTPPSNPTFGIVEGMWFPEVTCELGVGWERLIFNWAEHQPESADDWYTLNVDDRWLKAGDHCDREIVALLKHTPAWATDGTPDIGVPRGLDLSIDDPENTWAQFVYKTADYYASRGVYRFIIWNEPDIEEGTYGYEFEGDIEDYAQMIRVAYLAAKRANPSAQIHLAGTTYWHDVNEGRAPYTERLIDQLMLFPDAEENNYFFDAVSLHIYFRTETVYSIIREVQDMLDRHNLSHKAIWVNETNAAPTDDPAWQVERPVFQLNLQHQASFLIQSASLALAAGAERIAAYKLYDQNLPTGAESFGILSPPTAQPRPAYYAWQTVNRYFRNIEQADYIPNESVDIVRLQHSYGGITLVAWARTQDNVSLRLNLDSEKVYRIDEYGSITVLRQDHATWHFELPSAHCTQQDGCFLGGRVLMLSLPSNNFDLYLQTNQNDVPLILQQE
jgi:hypothetical protein